MYIYLLFSYLFIYLYKTNQFKIPCVALVNNLWISDINAIERGADRVKKHSKCATDTYV